MNQEQLAMLIQLLKQRGLLAPSQPQMQPQLGLLQPMQLAGDPRTKYTGTATIGTRG